MFTLWRLLFLAVLTASAVAAQEQAVLTWSSFETDAEVAAWKTLGTGFEASAKYATEGRRSGRIHFRQYAGQAGEEQWPRVTAFATSQLYPADWSGWAALALDLTTDAPEGVRVSLEIRGVPGKNGWTSGYALQSGVTQRVVVSLDEVRQKVGTAQVAEVLVYKGKPEADSFIYLDNLRLLRPEVDAMLRAVDIAAGALELLWTRDGRAAKQQAELDALRELAGKPNLTLAEAAAISQRAEALTATIAALRLRPLRAYDFGPAGSPVRDGFTAVTKDTVRDAGHEYGWRTAAGLKEVTRPAAREWVHNEHYRRDIPPSVYLNELTQDLVGGEKSVEFSADLPAGDYVVWLLAGFPSGYEPPVNDFTVDAGAGAVRIGLPERHIFESRFVPARAGADGLTVKFTPETGFVVNALAVFATGDLRRARKEFAGPIDQEVFRSPADLWPRWRQVPHAPEQGPPPTDEERRRGYVVFTRPYVENIYPDSVPAADERCQAVSSFATLGEYEPLNVAVQALKPLDGVTVAVGELRGPGVIGAERIDVRQVRCWPVRTHYSVFDRYRVVPELLDPVAPTDVEAGVCHRFWLTIHVPPDARPGVYRGQAVVRAENAPESRVALELEVLPLTLLRDPAKSFGNYYRSPLDGLSARQSPAVQAAIRRRAEAEARDMQEHGMNTVQMGGIGAKKVDGQWQATIELDERIEFLRRFGLWGDAPGVMMSAFFSGAIYRDFTGQTWPKHLYGVTGAPQGYFDALTRIVEQVEQVRLARGWPDFYYYPIDEAADEAVPFLAQTLAAIKRVPTAKTYATQVFERPGSRPLDEVLDVWCSAIFCTESERVEALRQQGRIFWCYPNFVACSRGVPNSARMTYGFGLWRMGYSCLIPWHYQAPASNSNPFCDFDGLYGDWCLAYPGPDGPIPTQRWEGVREGIDDGRYVYTLEARLAEARRTGRNAAAAAAAEKLLAELKAAVPVRATYDQDGPWRGADYAPWRRRLADSILAFG